MNLVSWLVVIIPMVYVMGMGFDSRRYVRDITACLASARVAGRYVISITSAVALPASPSDPRKPRFNWNWQQSSLLRVAGFPLLRTTLD